MGDFLKMNAEKKRKRIRNMLEYLVLLAKHLLLTPVSRLLYGKKHVWIISERGTDARDNGFHFFRYVRNKHPEQNAYYIIDKKSADYPKVSALGNTVQMGSLKHWLLFLGAEMRISTHINGYVPGKHWRYRDFVSHEQKIRAKVVFLRHGIGKDNVRGHYRDRTNIRLFLCGAKREYDYVLSHYGYSREEVKYTGLARFDSLHGFRTKRQVLIMPTWRDWLSPDFSGRGLSEQEIRDSLYVQRWSSLLGNGRLRALAEKYHVAFIFYPHYEMQRFLSLFPQGDEAVVIADFAHYDVQQLLKESMLLITDFSSVFFDFAYMHKPTLYYQFDEDEYRAHHYAQGYFDYRRDGFGEVVTDDATLLELLERYLVDDCRMQPEYQRRIEGFFPLHDDKNCERIYNEIRKLQ